MCPLGRIEDATEKALAAIASRIEGDKTCER
jgi:hypothetical protein